MAQEVRKALDDNGFPASTPIIATSAKSRQGRVEIWDFLRLVFDVDRRSKGKSGSIGARGADALHGTDAGEATAGGGAEGAIASPAQGEALPTP